MRIHNIIFGLLLIIITQNINAQSIPANYYDGTETLTGESLKAALNNIIQDHTEFTYTSTSTDTWDILKESDVDPTNAANVIQVYSGRSVNGAQEYNSGSGWSREHVWPQSRGDFNTSRGIGTDLHNLKPVDISVNSARSNRWFDYADYEYIDNGYATGSKSSSDRFVWEPRDEVKGDIARIIFYIATRYEGENGELDMEITDIFPDDASNEPLMALMSTLKTWHQQDPVDAFEINRNEVIYSYQGNRNPFIDHPEFVARIWGPALTEALFISEYIEGSSYDKAIELFNNSQQTINLTNVKLERDNGGNKMYSYSLNLEGTIEPYDVFVIAHSSANNQILQKADFTTNSSAMTFNGDDQLRLVYNGTETDHVGVAGNFGQDKTFIRAGHITASSTTEESPQASINWFEIEEGNYEFLGYHKTNETVTVPQLFISEYIEGSGYNKAIEIYNASTEPVNLRELALLKQTNGTDGYEGINLYGAIAPGTVYCIAHADADHELLKKAHFITDNSIMTFNGNDPLQLVYKGVVIDQLGTSGGANFAKDKGIYRDGRRTIPSSVWQSNDWYNLLKDDFSNFGFHKDDNKTTLALATSQNYIVTKSPLIATNEISSDHTITDIATQVNYFDGLGRPIQKLVVAQSPSQSDIISGHVYDNLGREPVKYIPYTRKNNGGTYRSSGFGNEGEQEFYYLDEPDYDIYGSDRDYTYSETIYDNSPLNRVMKQGASGQDWQPQNTTERQAGEHIVSYEYGTNTSTEVYLFRVDKDGTLDKMGIYDTGKFFANTVTDENGNQSRKFKNLQGQVILKESFDNSNWLQTYYVYDDFGMLRYVIPPKAVVEIMPGAISQANLQNQSWASQLCYYYKYDERKRLVEKRLPGAETIEMLYDNRDRLVLTQDGELRKNNEYLFTKYDEFNRTTVTGKVYISGEPSQIESYFDDYQNSQAYTYGTDGYDCDYPATQSIAISNQQVFTETYYDDYTYPGKYQFETSTCIANALPGNGYETNVKGLVTGTKTLMGNSGNDWVKESIYYDDYGRVTWSKRNVDIGSIAVTETQSTRYNFIGLAVQTKQIQHFNNQTTIINTINSYDHAGRLIQTDQQVEGQAWETTAQMKYNELGQLVEKKLGNGLQTIDFEYNIRGWMTKINDPMDAVDENTGNDLFAMELMYNKYSSSVNSSTDKQYNGNITAIQWTAKNNSQVMERQAYGFTYDGVNRLLNANYAIGQLEPVNDGFVNVLTASDDYKVSNISCDLNGNIMSLNRKEKGLTGYLDALTYEYSGNQLVKVSEGRGADYDNGFKTTTAAQALDEQYTYDANGNMLTDENKGITSIEYNHLNLPKKVTLGTNHIDYIYDAVGIKYKKITSDGLGTRYYFSNFEYDKDMALEYIHTSEGRIRVKSSFTYDYYLKDHLGNTRAIFTDEDLNGQPEELQVSNYYPFGMRFNQSNTYNIAGKTSQYMYNGKELDQDFDFDCYDYGARMYDPSLARFFTKDRYAENFTNWSPYHYANNNPILNIDINGDSTYNSLGFFQKIMYNILWGFHESGRYYNGGVGTFEENLESGVIHYFGALTLVQGHMEMVRGTSSSSGRVNSADDFVDDGINIAKQNTDDAFKAAKQTTDDVVEIVIDGNKYPESARHAADAIAEGKSAIGQIDRAGSAARRRNNLRGIATQTGKDRDEFPPAVVNTGESASVRSISASDNRGAGGSIGGQIRKLPDGTWVTIKPEF